MCRKDFFDPFPQCFNGGDKSLPIYKPVLFIPSRKHLEAPKRVISGLFLSGLKGVLEFKKILNKSFLHMDMTWKKRSAGGPYLHLRRSWGKYKRIIWTFTEGRILCLMRPGEEIFRSECEVCKVLFIRPDCTRQGLFPEEATPERGPGGSYFLNHGPGDRADIPLQGSDHGRSAMVSGLCTRLSDQLIKLK